jgi:SAM-dependent methyltransferase
MPVTGSVAIACHCYAVRLDDPSVGLPATPREQLALDGLGLDAFVAFWSRWAELDDRPLEPGDEERRLAADLTTLAGRTGTILEVGCSSGRLLRAVADALPEHDVHGYDVAPAALERAATAEATLHHGNGYDLGDLPDGSVDLVVSTHTLQHVPKPVALNLLKETYRVLSPGGRLWLEVPNLLRDDRLLAFNHFAQPAMVQRPFPMFFWTPDEATRLLTFAGFWVWSVTDRMEIVAGKTGIAGVAPGVAAGAATA